MPKAKTNGHTTKRPAPRALPPDDSKLIAECEKFVALELEYRRLAPRADGRRGWRRKEQFDYEAQLLRVGDQAVTVGLRLAAMQARTVEGIARKAAACRVAIEHDPVYDSVAALVRSVIRDAAALEPVR